MCIYLVILSSQELDHLLVWGVNGNEEYLPDLLADRRQAAYALLWGISSFLFMWYGMRRRSRTIRIFALSLFALTLVKLFLFDLGSLSEGGRVAAFILLGVLLLIVSFMYQRLKGLLLEDEKKIDEA